MSITRVLIIASSDSGGGAGIQADIKAVAASGGHAATVFAALTAQNTVGVQAVYPLPLDFIRRQFESIADDIGLDAIKTGMLYDASRVKLAAELISYTKVPVVVDPVMVSKGGDRLLTEEAVTALRDKLLPQASLITPNLDEAEVLLGRRVRNREEMEQAARTLSAMGPKAVLIKGGHLTDEPVDVLFDGHAFRHFTAPRIETPNTHGTGCSLASGIACFLGQGLPLEAAISKARSLVRFGISHSLAIGKGHGPVHLLARQSEIFNQRI
ncbi:MAG: bifunctional hydroxymethylpyrimidine kinase/phosphomethylpyrimidine kinase [Desulfarculales bacterium]|jgi:hydroxymethylpyrimidine kinase/phosphomethylpyrimidine kinase|nr:bifunctional hydroxymethylpyrimidine kinase/phosphomethylpyrimidine kinase [Desulfarculales bacterium]